MKRAPKSFFKCKKALKSPENLEISLDRPGLWP